MCVGVPGPRTVPRSRRCLRSAWRRRVGAWPPERVLRRAAIQLVDPHDDQTGRRVHVLPDEARNLLHGVRGRRVAAAELPEQDRRFGRGFRQAREPPPAAATLQLIGPLPRRRFESTPHRDRQTVAAVASRPRLGRSCSMCPSQAAQPRELPTSNPGPAPMTNTSPTPTLKGSLVRRARRPRRVVFTGTPVGPASLGAVREPVGEASGALFGAIGHVRPRRPRPAARWLLSAPPAERRPSRAVYPQADTPQAD